MPAVAYLMAEGVTPLPVIRTKVQALQPFIEALPQVEPPVAHFFCEGMYMRPMLLEKGMCCIGKIHTHGQMNICSYGDLSVLTHRGMERVQAGFHYVGVAGSQRAFYAHEESLWTIVLRTDETDIEKIEAEFGVDTEMEYQEFLKRVA